MKPRISVIVVTHNDQKWIGRMIDSLEGQDCGEWELIAVDSASTDSTVKCIRQRGYRVYENRTNIGFAAGSNRGAKVAKGDYLYFLNADTWLEKRCLWELLQATERSGYQGAAGAVLEYDSANVQRYPNHGFDVFGDSVRPMSGRFTNTVWCPARFFFIERRAFNFVGGFDEAMFMYGEEMDLGWRLRLSGMGLAPAPKAKIHHRSEPPTNETNTQRRFLANRNRLVTITKNAQHVLLLLLIPCAAQIFLEGIVTLLMTLNWRNFTAACVDPFKDAWAMRNESRLNRCRVNLRRVRSDWQLLRFLKPLAWGRIDECGKIFKRGFPKFT